MTLERVSQKGSMGDTSVVDECLPKQTDKHTDRQDPQVSWQRTRDHGLSHASTGDAFHSLKSDSCPEPRLDFQMPVNTCIMIWPSRNHSRSLFPKANPRPLPPNARSLLAHRACSSLAEVGLLGLGLSNALGQNLSVLVLGWQSASDGIVRTSWGPLTASSFTFSA